MHAALNACMNSEKWLAASQPFCGPRMADMARTVKMGRLPGARMGPPGARAQGAVAGDILWPCRARARVSRSKFREIRAPRCHFAVKMGDRTVLMHRILVLIRLRARVSRSKFHKIRAPQCQSAVKMGDRTVVALLDLLLLGI